MKYIIVGRNDAKGIVGDDCNNLSRYTELGWELVGTRIDVIKMLQEKEIDQEGHFIVTIGDRKFLYTKIFKNVISYDDFINIKNDGFDIYDMAYDTMFKNQTLSFLDRKKFVDDSNNFETAKYKRFHQDYDLITNIDFTDVSCFHKNEKYVCLCLRYRSHTVSRNSPEKIWNKIIGDIKRIGIKIFVVGKGAEHKCDGKSVIYIEKLSDYASLINNPLCLATIGTPTGTMLLGHFCCKNKLIVIDHSSCLMSEKYNHAVYGGDCVKFMNIPYIIIKDINKVNKISDFITH